MHIYFLGIGGSGLGPQAQICKQLGYDVSGSDKQNSEYIKYLKSQGITDITIGSSADIAAVHAKNPIDWLVYSYAVTKENPDHPVLAAAQDLGIKATDRGDLLVHIIREQNFKLVAIAGTHGKTTTTSMTIWAFKELGIPVSYSVGGKSSFAEMGAIEPGSEYFVYECDEYERNFLKFHPHLSLISGVDWDHPDSFPTRQDYEQAFRDFIDQSERTILWQSDAKRLSLEPHANLLILPDKPTGISQLKLPGLVNRLDAWLVVQGVASLTEQDNERLIHIMNGFPGVSRRFEKLADNIYTDYAHTPEKIRGTLATAHEVAGDNVVVVYEGLHNTRQHFIKDELAHLFDSVKKLYIVPSYRAREDESLEDLTPEKLIKLTSKPEKAEPAGLNEDLKSKVTSHAKYGDLVLCLSAGGGHSLDEWLRKELVK